MEKIYISQEFSLVIIVLVGLFFVTLGYFNSRKIPNNKNYIVGDRSENSFSLTTSLTASALGAWILFGPASASTWGGLGAVFGYALGTAAPMLFLFNFGPKIRKEFPNGLTLTEFIKKRFGIGILKMSLFLIFFYMTIFLIAEVTAIAFLLNLSFDFVIFYRKFELFFTIAICTRTISHTVSLTITFTITFVYFLKHI